MTQPSSDANSRRVHSQSRYVSRAGGKLAAALDHFRVDVAGCVCADLGSQIGGFVDCLLQRGAIRIYAVDTCYGTLAWKLRRDPRVVVLERANAMHVSLTEPVDVVTIDVGWTTQCKILPNVTRLIVGPLAGAADGLPGSDSGEGSPPRSRKSAQAGSPATPCVVTLIKPHYEVSRVAADPWTKPLSTNVGYESEPGAQATGPQATGPQTPRSSRTNLPAARCAAVTSPTAIGAGGLGSVTHAGAGSSTPILVEGVLPDKAADQVVERVLQEVAAIGWTVCATFPSPIRGHGGNREVFALLKIP